jgi:predicted ester cyclase
MDAMTGAALADLYRAYIACLNRQDWRNLHQFVADDARQRPAVRPYRRLRSRRRPLLA